MLALLSSGRRRRAAEASGFLPDCVVLFRRLLADRRVPRRSKAALRLVLPYLVSPLDLVPDFIPVVGRLDDALLATAALRYVTRSVEPAVVGELWPGTEPGLRAVLAL